MKTVNIKDEFNIEVTFPEEYHDEKLKGQPATFAIKVKEIKQRVIPELTDDFVKKSTRFASVDDLKADIQNFIDSQRESLKKSAAENSVFKSISDSTKIDIPQTMIEREISAIINENRQRIAYQNGNWDKFIEAQGGEAAYKSGVKNEAKVRIKNSLIIDKIAKEEKITVEQADFSNRLSQLSAAYGITPDQLVKQFGQDPNFLSGLSQQIINDKVRNFLVENNKFEYVEITSK